MPDVITRCISSFFGICYLFIYILYQILGAIYNFNIEIFKCSLSVHKYIFMQLYKCKEEKHAREEKRLQTHEGTLVCTLQNTNLPKYSTMNLINPCNLQIPKDTMSKKPEKLLKVITNYDATSNLSLHVHSRNSVKNIIEEISRSDSQNLYINKNKTEINTKKCKSFNKQIKSLHSFSEEIRIDRIQLNNLSKTYLHSLGSRFHETCSIQSVFSLANECSTNVNELKRARLESTMTENINDNQRKESSNFIKVNISETEVSKRPITTNIEIQENEFAVLKKVKKILRSENFVSNFPSCVGVMNAEYTLHLSKDKQCKTSVEKRNKIPTQFSIISKANKLYSEIKPQNYRSSLSIFRESDCSMQSMFLFENNSQLADICAKNRRLQLKIYSEANGSVLSELSLFQNNVRDLEDVSMVDKYGNIMLFALHINNESAQSDDLLETNFSSTSKRFVPANASNQLELFPETEGDSLILHTLVFQNADWKHLSTIFLAKIDEKLSLEIFFPKVDFNHQSKVFSEKDINQLNVFPHTDGSFLETLIRRRYPITLLHGHGNFSSQSVDCFKLPKKYNEISISVLTKNTFSKVDNMLTKYFMNSIGQFLNLKEVNFEKVKIHSMKNNLSKCFQEKEGELFNIIEADNKSQKNNIFLLEDEKAVLSNMPLGKSDVERNTVVTNFGNTPEINNAWQLECFPLEDESERSKISKHKNYKLLDIVNSKENTKQSTISQTRNSPVYSTILLEQKNNVNRSPLVKENRELKCKILLKNIVKKPLLETYITTKNLGLIEHENKSKHLKINDIYKISCIKMNDMKLNVANFDFTVPGRPNYDTCVSLQSTAFSSRNRLSNYKISLSNKDAFSGMKNADIKLGRSDFDFHEEYPVLKFSKIDIMLNNHLVKERIFENVLKFLNFDIDNNFENSYNPIKQLATNWNKLLVDSNFTVAEERRTKWCTLNKNHIEKQKYFSRIQSNQDERDFKNPIINDKDYLKFNQKKHDFSNQNEFFDLYSNIVDTLKSFRESDTDQGTEEITESLNFDQSSFKNEEQQMETYTKFEADRSISEHSLGVNDIENVLSKLDKCSPDNIKIPIKSTINKNSNRRNREKRKCKNKEIKGKEVVCSAQEIKQNRQNFGDKLLDLTAFNIPVCLVSVNMKDYNCFIDEPLKIRKLQYDDDYFDKEWTKSDTTFCRTVMGSDVFEKYQTHVNYKKNLSEKQIMRTPTLCNGIHKKDYKITIGKRKVKCIIENQTDNSNGEINVNKKSFDGSQGMIAGKLRITKVPANSPPKRRSKFSSSADKKEVYVKYMSSSSKLTQDTKKLISKADDNSEENRGKCMLSSLKVDNSKKGYLKRNSPVPVKALDNNKVSKEKNCEYNSNESKRINMTLTSEANSKSKKVNRKNRK